MVSSGIVNDEGVTSKVLRESSKAHEFPECIKLSSNKIKEDIDKSPPSVDMSK